MTTVNFGPTKAPGALIDSAAGTWLLTSRARDTIDHAPFREHEANPLVWHELGPARIMVRRWSHD